MSVNIQHSARQFAQKKKLVGTLTLNGAVLPTMTPTTIVTTDGQTLEAMPTCLLSIVLRRSSGRLRTAQRFLYITLGKMSRRRPPRDYVIKRRICASPSAGAAFRNQGTWRSCCPGLQRNSSSNSGSDGGRSERAHTRQMTSSNANINGGGGGDFEVRWR